MGKNGRTIDTWWRERTGNFNKYRLLDSFSNQKPSLGNHEKCFDVIRHPILRAVFFARKWSSFFILFCTISWNDVCASVFAVSYHARLFSWTCESSPFDKLKWLYLGLFNGYTVRYAFHNGCLLLRDDLVLLELQIATVKKIEIFAFSIIKSFFLLGTWSSIWKWNGKWWIYITWWNK